MRSRALDVVIGCLGVPPLAATALSGCSSGYTDERRSVSSTSQAFSDSTQEAATCHYSASAPTVLHAVDLSCETGVCSPTCYVICECHLASTVGPCPDGEDPLSWNCPSGGAPSTIWSRPASGVACGGASDTDVCTAFCDEYSSSEQPGTMSCSSSAPLCSGCYIDDAYSCSDEDCSICSPEFCP